MIILKKNEENWMNFECEMQKESFLKVIFWAIPAEVGPSYKDLEVFNRYYFVNKDQNVTKSILYSHDSRICWRMQSSCCLFLYFVFELLVVLFFVLQWLRCGFLVLAIRLRTSVSQLIRKYSCDGGILFRWYLWWTVIVPYSLVWCAVPWI